MDATTRALLKREHPFVPWAHLNPAGRLTIGYGHVGPSVRPGQVATQAQGEGWLSADIKRVEAALRHLIPVPLTPPQRTALISYCHSGADLAASHLPALLGAGVTTGPAVTAAFLLPWPATAALLARRQREAALFLSSTF